MAGWVLVLERTICEESVTATVLMGKEGFEPRWAGDVGFEPAEVPTYMVLGHKSLSSSISEKEMQSCADYICIMHFDELDPRCGCRDAESCL